MDTSTADTELDVPFSPIDLGPDFDTQYGASNPTTDFNNSNLSPHFPYAAQIWSSLWAQKTGATVDGVIAIDPVAFSYILGAVSSITVPSGEVITKDNVIELTESTIDHRFPTNQLARKQYLGEVASAIVSKMAGLVESPRNLLDALGRAVGGGHIAVWSSHPAEQVVLETSPVVHVVPDDRAPFAAVVINSLDENATTYYLRRQIAYTAAGCAGETRESTVTLRLTNAIPARTPPDSVTGSGWLRGPLPVGDQSDTATASISLIATRNATLRSAAVDGKNAPTATGAERGHPVYQIQVTVPARRSVEVTFLLTEPTAPGPARVPVQPLLDDVTPAISVPQCS